MPRRHDPRRPWKTAGAGRSGPGGRSPRMGQANVFHSQCGGRTGRSLEAGGHQERPQRQP
eukprot:15615447-Heterocapsa_arctica.AAC.1